MSMDTAIAVLLALAAVAAALRHALRWRRLPAPARPTASRMAAILLLQFACAALLYATLLPPGRSSDESRLVVMTAGADVGAANDVMQGGAILVALPEAGADAVTAAGARRMPDLATTLRTYPRTGHLHVLGAGLEARDIDAARGLPVTFNPPPLPHGVVELHAPARVVTGGLLHVSGRIHDAAGTAVELLDPAGAVQDRARPDAEGRFLLQAPVRASGPALFGLRLQGGSGTEAAIPVDARPGDSARLLLLAGAPSPELKYLRRWASDAGLRLHSRMALGGGITLGDGPLAFDAETLAGFDLLIVDERAWAGLAAGARSAVLAAVEKGLGLMVRITGRPDATTHDALRQLGFVLGELDSALGDEVLLDGVRTPESADAVASATGTIDAAVPALARQPYPLRAAGSVSLLDDASGRSLARWRQSGRGRIAVWNLDQSFRLVLTGHDQRHARLWSEATGTLARTGAPRQPRFEGIARAGERATLCDFEPGSALVGGDGIPLHPLPDPAAGCAAVWPRISGWHRLGDGAATPGLYVHAAEALPGLAARARREATLRLATSAANRSPNAPEADTPPVTGSGDVFIGVSGTIRPGTRWPWFLAWLLAAGLLWRVERGGRGNQAAARL